MPVPTAAAARALRALLARGGGGGPGWPGRSAEPGEDGEPGAAGLPRAVAAAAGAAMLGAVATFGAGATLGAFGAALGAATPALAQDLGTTLSPIVTVDTDRLFAATVLGRKIGNELANRVQALAEENRRITTELEAEEMALTEQRATLDPAEFRKLADAFDKKVQRIRAEQDAKQAELQKLRDAERTSFFSDVTPFLTRIAREHEAVVVMDRRNVLFSASSIDITDEAIRQINRAIENGQIPKHRDSAAPAQGPDGPAPDGPAPDAPAPGTGK